MLKTILMALCLMAHLTNLNFQIEIFWDLDLCDDWNEGQRYPFWTNTC